ncbi:two-component system response regulator NarL [Xanthobacter sp. TB0139]|uniref:two-component system response regulator NarL n=1 Tax=Xanthobacter sp. TB0139 TaxID=3459178 RepID=UPI0040399D6F
MIRVLLIEDHALFRKGVRDMISDHADFEVVGEASSGQEGLECAVQLQPDMVLIDLNMKGMNGLETLRRLKNAGLNARCIVLTVSDAREDLLEALRAGADGYLLKDMEPEDLCPSLLKAFAGTTVLQESLTSILKEAALEPLSSPRSAGESELTDRERQVLQCLAEGLNNKAIARDLGISSMTVKVHVKNVLRKLNLTSRLEAAVWKHRSDQERRFPGAGPVAGEHDAPDFEKARYALPN